MFETRIKQVTVKFYCDKCEKVQITAIQNELEPIRTFGDLITADIIYTCPVCATDYADQLIF